MAYPSGVGSTNVIEILRHLDGIELMIARGTEASVEIFSRHGRGIIHEIEGEYLYRFEGSDPLGYASDSVASALLDGAPHGGRGWLHATQHSRFPDAVLRLRRLLHVPGCGNVAITSAEGYDLGLDYELVVGNYRGGHGGLRRDQLVVPYVLSGPGVLNGVRLESARAEDVGATLLELVGAEPEAQGDGRVLWEILHPRNRADGRHFRSSE
jgi:hypothetical protein